MSITEINTSNRSTTINTPNNSSVTTTASRSTTVTPNRQAAINGLAVVGFVALVVAGVWLAVYSTRFVPTVVNNVGAAAVYLGSVFTSGKPSLSVIPTPTASTTISFGAATTTPTDTTPKTSTTEPVTPKPTYTAPVTPSPYGLSDLSVSILATGYQTNLSSPESFVDSSTVPVGTFPAVKIRIKNIGTNFSGTWNLRASIPNNSKVSQVDSLAPGEIRDFVSTVDSVRSGSTQNVTITANFDRIASESNYDNNEESFVLNVP